MGRAATAEAPAAPAVTLQVECLCGSKYEIDPAHAGQRFHCEGEECGRVLSVPTPAWSTAYTQITQRLSNPACSERERKVAVEALAKLGTLNAVPAIMRAVYDPSREVVNTALKALLTMGDPGQRHLIALMREGTLRISRLVAMIRELEWWEGAGIICDLIDAGLLNESQISETITLLGESRQRRCISTLTALRRGFPNLAMLVDNALAHYRHLDSQVNKIPDDAKLSEDGNEVDAARLGAVQRSASIRSGCLPSLILLLAAPAAAVTWLLLS